MPDHSHTAPPSDPELRIKALESLLVEKQLIDPDAVDAIIDTYETKIGPRNGAKVVARAWVDPEYKARLLADATKAIAELGFSGVQGEDMVVVENTDEVHNVVVCTLCSCYPWPTLGLPPVWYKAAPYRSRVVRDPRGVLLEFGTRLSDDVEVRVWDSNAELGYPCCRNVRPAPRAGPRSTLRTGFARRHDRYRCRVSTRSRAMNGVHDLGACTGSDPSTPSPMNRSSIITGSAASTRAYWAGAADCRCA